MTKTTSAAIRKIFKKHDTKASVRTAGDGSEVRAQGKVENLQAIVSDLYQANIKATWVTKEAVEKMALNGAIQWRFNQQQPTQN